MINQHPLITLSAIREDRLDMLKTRLETIRVNLLNSQMAEAPTEFGKVSTLHYGRWIILSRESFRDEPAIPVGIRLVLSTNYDAVGNNHVDYHLTELVTKLTTYIDDVYECCTGYPEPGARTEESRKNFLKKGIISTSAFYNGAPGRSVEQIHQEDALHQHVWKFLTSKKWDEQTPAVEIHRAIRQEVDSRPEFAWTKEKAGVQGIKWLPLIAYGLLFIILLPLIIVWLIYLFIFHELWDKNVTLAQSELNDAKINELKKVEDIFPQNQFTQVAVLKPGFARNLNFRIWMMRTEVLASYVFVKGKLLNIPTIHFARWVLIDKNKHVLFFSNFDGNWEQYLGDFIDQSGWGLTSIFSNTVKFPRTNFMGVLGIIPGMPLTFPGTRFVLTGGAYDEEHFLAWSRSTQLPTQVWYCPYRHLSIKNINNNTNIRNGLREDLNEEQAKIFLKRF
ncbi:MAG TPA: hypothetical protein VK645_11850 [Chitinophagaceae bacterium]|nr:hypothetical protein [Chitinophagaceae bacterium]